MNDTVITREGLERLSEELDRLVTDGRREIAERLRHAVTSEANPVENGDYLDVREEQALLERRITTLQERLHAARATRSVDVPTGHHPFVTRPDLVAEQVLALR